MQLLHWQIPFSMNLKQHGEENLERFYETFHGADINIQVRICQGKIVI